MSREIPREARRVRTYVLGVLSCALFGACSPGVGRDPIDFDPSRPRDGGLRADVPPPEDVGPRPDADADPRDSGVPDSAIALPDAAPPPTSVFSGVFGILNAQEPLYAREVGGKLNLVVGNFPYDYIGAISLDGVVSTTSNELSRNGCAVARVTGTYDRASATYRMTHETCNAQGAPITSPISGGFAQDFDPARSGVYDLAATVTSNPGPCFDGPSSGHTVRYAFNFLPSLAMSVFTAEDLISTPAWYQGQASLPDYAFSAIQRLDASPSPLMVAMSGRFEQATANDPVRFVGFRDVYDPEKSCGFTITLDGTRVEAP